MSATHVATVVAIVATRRDVFTAFNSAVLDRAAAYQCSEKPPQFATMRLALNE